MPLVSRPSLPRSLPERTEITTRSAIDSRIFARRTASILTVTMPVSGCDFIEHRCAEQRLADEIELRIDILVYRQNPAVRVSAPFPYQRTHAHWPGTHRTKTLRRPTRGLRRSTPESAPTSDSASYQRSSSRSFFRVHLHGQNRVCGPPARRLASAPDSGFMSPWLMSASNFILMSAACRFPHV